VNPFDAERTAAHIDGKLRALAAPERAEAERCYLKSELDHLGVTVWQIRREVKAFGEEHPSLSHTELIAVVQALWSRRVHERRMAAAMLLEAYPASVLPTDLTLLKRLIRESKTWALVDVLAGDVIGRLLVRHPRAESRLDR
jgi:3-methyladenine DNA glycosylase AlkD